MLRILCLILSVYPLLVPASALGTGAWYRDTGEIPSPKSPGFDPEFTIIKVGAFAKTGVLKPIQSKDLKEAWKTHCATHRESIAWFAHKRTKKETMSPQAGATLAKSINQLLKSSCFSAIELDIEPLAPFEANAWIFPFLKSVRENLDVSLKLRLAVPAISPEKIPGPYWDLADAVKIFRVVDGIDVMLYDSGLGTEGEYGELFKNAFFFAMELVKEAQDKTIVLGLPAYQDKTKLHRATAENLSAVNATLKTFTPFQAVNLCLKRVRFAYYAGWTLTPNDIAQHQKIEEWKADACKKDP